MPPEPLIRPAFDDDVPAIASLIGELGYPISLMDMRNRFDFVTASANDEILVAEVDGEVVGLVGVRVAEPIHRVGRVGEVTALVVASAQKRRGIGSALLARAEEWLTARGADTVGVHAGNHRKDEAHRFYTAQGYEATQTVFRKSLEER